jgi:hypothetical protein
MSKLLERLMDPVRSGVYRVGRADEVLDAAGGSTLSISRIPAPAKAALLRTMAKQLDFPDWFGENWDALEDCLTDLSWHEAAGYVLLLEQFHTLGSGDLATLTDVLSSAAAFWAAQGKPFFAVFVDPERTLKLPDLFRRA